MNGNEFFSYSFSFTQPWHVPAFHFDFHDAVDAELKRMDDLECAVLAANTDWVSALLEKGQDDHHG